MRRVVSLIVVLALLGGGILAATGGAQTEAGSDGGSFRVDAIFDTAKGIVPGQLVKVAGARVGEVADVTLTDDFRARIQMDVDGRFAPFRQDARCDIQPEGLISENFVQCDPGSVDAPPLTAGSEAAPTVPLERTAVPVNLTDLFEIFETPVRDRLRVLLNSLGAGLAGRGEDLNALLRRANPTLGLVRETLDILNDQKTGLQDAVVQTKAVTGELAREPERLQGFVSDSASVLERTTRRRQELRESIRRLPAALAAARPALAGLDAFAEQAEPLATDLQAAAPQLEGLLATAAPLARTARPAIRGLGSTADGGRDTVRVAAPTVTDLKTFSAAALPTGGDLAALLVDMRDRGFVEGLLSFVYNAGAATSRYDTTSHILPAHILLSSCGVFATQTDPACDANYSRAGRPAADAEPRERRARRPETPEEPARGTAAPEPAPPSLTETPRPAAPTAPRLPRLPEVVEPVTGIVDGVLDALIGGDRAEKLLPGLTGERSGDDDEATRGLLDFLLK